MIIAFTPPNSDAPIDWAIAYATAGLAIFPCKASKRPITEHGFRDATTDETVIRGWWRQHPYADPAWAIPADVVVLDLDIGHGVGNGVKDFEERFGVSADQVETPQARSPRGGLHLVFAAHGAPYRQGKDVKGAAIDIKTAGGYIVLPGPGNGREWIKPLSTLLAPVPDWVPKADDRRGRAPQIEAQPFSGEISNYALTALEEQLAVLAAARPGVRNPTLNTAAFSLGQLIAGGELPRGRVEDLLYGAATINGLIADDGERSVRATIRSGIESGFRQPRNRLAEPSVALTTYLATAARRPWRRASR